jgi:hypothetical protein
MTSASSRPIASVRDGLLSAVRNAADYNPTDVEAPIAVLWPDADAAWNSALPQLADDVQLIRLGRYQPDLKIGPATYIRIAAFRLAPRGGASGALPLLIYLPGVSRRQLADAASLPEELRPLAGLVSRSAVFAQRNGSDWTPLAFLTNPGLGLNLKAASDTSTKAAIARSLPRLMEVEIAALRGKTLRSDDFDQFVVDDPVRDLLLWLDCPNDFRATSETGGKWAGFVSLVTSKYKVDPEKDGVLVAGAHLGDRTGPWSAVWARYAESPRSYSNIPDVLRRSKPEGIMPLHTDSWPQDNEAAEASALSGLSTLVSAPVADIREKLVKLAADHRLRLTSVWATLGQTPAAEAVEQLSKLAESTSSIVYGSTVTELARGYATSGWHADDLFIGALRTLDPGHQSAATVTAVAEALYRPWLEATCNSFQKTWLDSAPAVESGHANSSAHQHDGTCIVFVDGLRFDVAATLSEALTQRGLRTILDWAIAAAPTVTSTSKPSVAPVSGQFIAGPELAPLCEGGAAYSQDQLKRALADGGWTFIPPYEDGDSSGRGWTEGGDIDNLGHSLGAKLAHQIPSQVGALTARISELLAAGWREVSVVTDHGWLLLPSKLPKQSLPEHLTVVRKGRCARLRKDVAAPPGISTVPWRWDTNVSIAVAPGIHAFEDGKVYEHGGLSPQESVVPRLVVTQKVSASPAKSITIDVSWVGYTAQVECESAPDGTHVDLRTKAADPTSSLVTRTKPLVKGKARLLAGDEHGGEAVVIVLVDEANHLLAQRLTQVPEG